MQDSVIENVLISLRRVIRATDLYSRDLVKSSGLTAPQLLVLQALASRPGMSVGELAQLLSLSQATISSILDRLERRELVQRSKSSQDKRKTQLMLGSKGRKAIEGAPLPLQERFVHRFTALEDWEQNQILSALQRVASMMDARELDASPVLDIGSLDREA